MAYIKRNFTVEELEEEYELPWNAISNEEYDKRRWYTVRLLVFKADDGFHYEVDYMDPATENQEGQERWNEDYKTGKVEAIRVEEVEIVTTKWEYVNA